MVALLGLASRHARAQAYFTRRRVWLLCIALLAVYLLSSYINTPTPWISPHFRQNDVFADYVGRYTCGFGAHDIVETASDKPFCSDRASLLRAATDGGRAGFDQPYIPRGCNIPLLSVADICRTLGKFEGILFIGDSLTRHLLTAFSMILRSNLKTGGQMSWESSTVEHDCTCDRQVQLFFCHQTDVRNMTSVYEHDGASFACPFLERPTLAFGEIPKYPITGIENSRNIDDFIISSIHPRRTNKPYAFVFGQGLWNDCRVSDSLAWIDQVQKRIAKLRPWMAQKSPSTLTPRIFVTPSAPGEKKPDDYLMTQGHKAVSQFERGMRDALRHYPGMDFLGTYNMSVQGTVPDGTHSGIRINLLKAMALANWLASFDTSKWEKQIQGVDAIEDDKTDEREAEWRKAIQQMSDDDKDKIGDFRELHPEFYTDGKDEGKEDEEGIPGEGELIDEDDMEVIYYYP